MLILLFVLFYASPYLQLIPIRIFNITEENITAKTNVMLNFFSNFCLAIILFFIYRKELKKEWETFKSNMEPSLYIGIKAWFIGLVVMLISNTIISFLSNGGIAGNEAEVQKMITGFPFLMIFNAGVVAPFNEEIIFRKGFKNAISNKYLFVILSGLVFGLLHVVGTINSWVDILYIIPYGALGCAFAYTYHKTDSVFTSMFIHMAHNLILVISSVL